MSLLADVVTGRFFPASTDGESFLRQLGYVAQLARHRIDDPEDRLRKVVDFCREQVKDRPAPSGQYRDPIQQRWGAPWHMDLGKLRTELPLQVKRLDALFARGHLEQGGQNSGRRS
ncbi:hypothetical protein [Salipiger mucosus]|uniref:hypothetical protein n=1 Tax=Salipiger mucosus TaxID=263378 RepID=UPI000559EE5B|nr:hypothetical protein [Salipiger mucosus]